MTKILALLIVSCNLKVTTDKVPRGSVMSVVKIRRDCRRSSRKAARDQARN